MAHTKIRHDCHRLSKMVLQLFSFIKTYIIKWIKGFPQARKFPTRNLYRFPHLSLDEIRNLSVYEQGNGAEIQKKHSDVLILEFGSHSKYTVGTVL